MGSMRLHLAAIALLASCAASPAREDFVFLESEAYGCGAAPGLGCGLAIAPVLERIDAEEGVAESSVSWDGRYFRIELTPSADEDRVVSAAASALGEGAGRVSSADRAAALEGVRWLSSEQTVALSLHEADVLATDFAAEIAGEAALDERTAQRLQTTLREELEGAFERAHAAGGGVDRLWAEFPAARSRFEERLAEFLTPDQRVQVSAILAREFDE